MRYPSHAPRGWHDCRFDSRAEGTPRRPAGESLSGETPRVPSVVSRTCEPKPTGQIHAYFLSSAWLRAPIRLLSTRAPRQAVLRASFWLAPCMDRHEDLRPPGVQDARCVRSTSATRTNCVYPAPRVLPAFTTAGFPAWAPHRVWARCGLTGGPSVFTTLEPLWRIDRTRRLRSAASEASRRPGLYFA